MRLFESSSTISLSVLYFLGFMVGVVFTNIRHDEIFKPVIGLYAVDVMNKLGAIEDSAKMFFHNESVFSNSATAIGLGMRRLIKPDVFMHSNSVHAGARTPHSTKKISTPHKALSRAAQILAVRCKKVLAASVALFSQPFLPCRIRKPVLGLRYGLSPSTVFTFYKAAFLRFSYFHGEYITTL